MKEVASRVLLALEAIFISLPLTLLFTFYFSSQFGNWHFSVAIASVVVCAVLFCGWWLTDIFVFRGRAALCSSSVWWWALPFLAAALAVIAALSKLFTTGTDASGLGVFFFGIPFFLPLIHLVIERLARGKSSF